MIKAINAWLAKPDWERPIWDQVLLFWVQEVALIVGLAIALAPLLAFIAFCAWMITGGK